MVYVDKLMEIFLYQDGSVAVRDRLEQLRGCSKWHKRMKRPKDLTSGRPFLGPFLQLCTVEKQTDALRQKILMDF